VLKEPVAHSTTFRPSRRAASVASSGDGLRLAILWDVRMKAVGAVDRVPARSTMRFRHNMQTGAMTVDSARLDDDGPRGS